MSFHGQPTNHLSVCEGQVRDCTGQLHPGQSTERVDETTVERRLAFGLVVSGVQGEAQRDRGVRVEAFFDGQDLDQTANKQPGPCQQDYGQRQLGDNHSSPKTTSRAFNASASCLSQDSGRIATRNGQGRKQTKQQARQYRDTKGEKHHGHVNGCLIQSRDVSGIKSQ